MALSFKKISSKLSKLIVLNCLLTFMADELSAELKTFIWNMDSRYEFSVQGNLGEKNDVVTLSPTKVFFKEKRQIPGIVDVDLSDEKSFSISVTIAKIPGSSSKTAPVVTFKDSRLGIEKVVTPVKFDYSYFGKKLEAFTVSAEDMEKVYFQALKKSGLLLLIQSDKHPLNSDHKAYVSSDFHCKIIEKSQSAQCFYSTKVNVLQDRWKLEFFLKGLNLL